MGDLTYAGLLFLIIFLIVFIIGLIGYLVNRGSSSPPAWSIWLMVWGGLLVFSGLVMMAVGLSHDAKKTRELVVKSDVPSRKKKVTYAPITVDET